MIATNPPMRFTHRINKRKLVETIIITVIVMMASLLCIFPFVWMIRTSLVHPNLINAGSTVLFTTKITFAGYKAVKLSLGEFRQVNFVIIPIIGVKRRQVFN